MRFNRSVLLLHICIHDECTEGDTLFFFNYRSDRMRQIVQTFGVSPPPFEVEIPKDLVSNNFN